VNSAASCGINKTGHALSPKKQESKV